MSIVSLEFLVANDFERRHYDDGWFWLIKAHDDLFIQVEESNNRVTVYDDGFIGDLLTDDELVRTIAQIKEYQ